MEQILKTLKISFVDHHSLTVPFQTLSDVSHQPRLPHNMKIHE